MVEPGDYSDIWWKGNNHGGRKMGSCGQDHGTMRFKDSQEEPDGWLPGCSPWKELLLVAVGVGHHGKGGQE